MLVSLSRTPPGITKSKTNLVNEKGIRRRGWTNFPKCPGQAGTVNWAARLFPQPFRRSPKFRNFWPTNYISKTAFHTQSAQNLCLTTSHILDLESGPDVLEGQQTSSRPQPPALASPLAQAAQD